MKIKKNESEESPRRVNLEEWYKNNGNLNRATSVPALEQFQDSLIARNFGEPQRLAILATSAQEMDKKGAASKGVGGNGMLGYSSERMPTKYLDDTAEGRAKQIHFLIEDMLTTHSNNWLDGGNGGPYIKNGKSAYNQFWNGTDATLLTKIFNKSLIRPRDREDAWDNRATVANNMSNYMYQKGGLVYNPFVPETKISKQVIDEPTFESLKISDYTRFPVEPVKTYSIPKETPTPQQIKIQVDNTKVEQPKMEKQKGTVSYKYKDLDVGNMQELIDLMVNEGISFRVTSGNRPGAKTKSGNPSHHGSGNALDITPIEGQTWDDLIAQMKASPKFIKYMNEHGLGILDERSKDVQIKTGATGEHFHIGPDLIAKTQFKYLIG